MPLVAGLLLTVLQAGPAPALSQAKPGNAERAPTLVLTRKNPLRLLLCKPKVLGNAKLARADALVDAAHASGVSFRDYSGVCETASEATNAAQLYHLRYAVMPSAEAQAGGSAFKLELAGPESDRALSNVRFEVANGVDLGATVKQAVSALVSRIPKAAPEPPEPKAPPPPPEPVRWAPWLVAGAGATAMLVGAGFALGARQAADDRDGSRSAGDYVEANNRWKSRKTVSGAALGVGACAVAVGLTWRFVY